MATKSFEFEDNSKITFEITDSQELIIGLQARHLGEPLRVTSSSAKLNSQELDDFVDWFSGILLQEEIDD